MVEVIKIEKDDDVLEALVATYVKLLHQEDVAQNVPIMVKLVVVIESYISYVPTIATYIMVVVDAMEEAVDVPNASYAEVTLQRIESKVEDIVVDEAIDVVVAC